MKNTFERNGIMYAVLIASVTLPSKGQNRTLTAGEICVDDAAQEWLVDKGNGENIVAEIDEADEEPKKKAPKKVPETKPAKKDAKSVAKLESKKDAADKESKATQE